MATVLSEQDFRDCIRPLQGLEVSLAWKGYGSAIFLELGRLSAPRTELRRHENGEACLSVEWDWRVESASSVFFGSSNTGPEIAAGIHGLQGSRTDNIAVVGTVPEIETLFSNGNCLRSMAMTSGDPRWGIRLPSGSWISARSGVLWMDAEPEGITGQDATEMKISEDAGGRWGIPVAEPVNGKCAACGWFRYLDAHYELLDYGVCLAETSPFDGKVVNRSSGCPVFNASSS